MPAVAPKMRRLCLNIIIRGSRVIRGPVTGKRQSSAAALQAYVPFITLKILNASDVRADGGGLVLWLKAEGEAQR